MAHAGVRVGALALAVALWPALDAAADRRLTAHMGEHLLLGLVAPALLALGAPVRLALGGLPPPGRRAVGRALHHPVVRALTRAPVATALVVGATVVVHLPGAVDAGERSAALHAPSTPPSSGPACCSGPWSWPPTRCRRRRPRSRASRG